MSDEPDKTFRLVDGEMVEVSAEEVAQIAAEAAEITAAPTPRSQIAKTTIYRRMSDPEMAALSGYIEQQATIRQRLMWQDAEGGIVLVDDIAPLAAALYGQERAEELLEP